MMLAKPAPIESAPLHLVDLDGAFAGEPKNRAVIQAITEAMDDSSLSGESIRQQLETALPAIISRQLREIGIETNNCPPGLRLS